MNDEAEDVRELIKNGAGYEELITAVLNINKKAAAYLDGPCRELNCFTATPDLADVMEWKDTPQGRTFWAMVYMTLANTGYKHCKDKLLGVVNGELKWDFGEW